MQGSGWVRFPQGTEMATQGRGGPSPLTKVDSLRHLASGHREQDGPAAVLAGLGRGGQDTDASPGSCAASGPLCPDSPCPPSTHLLVLLQGDAGLSPILGLDEEQLVPLDVLQDALRGGHREIRMWEADSGFKDGAVLLKLSSATDAPATGHPCPRPQPALWRPGEGGGRVQPHFFGKPCDPGREPIAIFWTSGAGTWPRVTNRYAPPPAGDWWRG